MLGKLLLTILVLLGAYGVLRARWRAERPGQGTAQRRLQRASLGTARLSASILLAVTAVGSALAIMTSWMKTQEVVEVQVVNANTGAVSRYLAHRGAIDGRRLETLDGREVRLADVERMIILPHSEETQYSASR